jgi:hypothetical protein
VAGDSVVRQVRDDLIAQDIRYRRVDASVRRDVDRLIVQLGKDLKKLIISIDVAGTRQVGARKRRLQKLNEQSRDLINNRYREINQVLRKAVRQVAKVETKSTLDIVTNRLP